ncbi:MAG: bifunctional 5,10-methylenetetrahydrofolate dehydrogenase/5,10-methenyltetrahydrofolate cyclohydrolase [Phycisphaeraceae bacterium]|nr:bifunctional 5,10-methylenetetrahydrofolate dehydrogenase/5,10-methenyltetrahydrofolate cyclohydrolase [Phycisphaeraceae bacterium]
MSPSPTILDGKALAGRIQQQVAENVRQILQRTNVRPCLVAVLVGEDPASAKYVQRKVKLCEELGLRSRMIKFPVATTTTQLVAKLNELSADPAVHGILLQHPVPAQIDEREAFEAIGPGKDVDGVTFTSFARMYFGLAGFGSCTPAGIMRLLEEYRVPIRGSHAVVIGRSAILGKPMAGMLLAADATVTVCHSKTRDLAGLVRQADIVIAAVGKPHFVKGDWIKPGAVVVDAGFNPGPRGNVGDVDFDAAAQKAGMITPVPGGVGPMTLAILMDQTVRAAAEQLKVELPTQAD